MSSRFFNTEANNHMKAQMFFDSAGAPAIARYEEVRYPRFEHFTETQLSFFWRPEEIDLVSDKKDFRILPPAQQHIFTSNLKRQILLDSVQGRGPNLVFLPLATLPEVEVWIETWGTNETIHSRSYTHIIKNVYSSPSQIFDEITEIPEILECAVDITTHYDELHRHNIMRESYNMGMITDYDEKAHKKAFWLALNSVNILEGIRFYVSFCCSFSFAENKTMEGNAKVIKFICRDENLHLGSTQYMLNTLPKDDPIYADIKRECETEVVDMFKSAIAQEKEWASYLFKDGSMLGLNEEMLNNYVDFIASRRMRTIGLPIDFDHPKSDPFPWMKSWIAGSDVQVAPQEAEISSYIISSIDKDVDDDFLDTLEL